jgi:hypothetical protein
MRALVVNCSAPHYSLGAAKLANWLRRDGHDVTEAKGDPGMFALGFDLVALSVIFSWHAPVALAIAQRVKAASDVWCGGPGIARLSGWWKRETGLEAVVGLDQRFEREAGAYPMTFASRGCPVGCWFCIVPKIEGSQFTLYHDFTPAPILCDNNLSALPVDFQEHIIRRYQAAGQRLVDAESGFEPATFDAGTFDRWRAILRGPWRFAYDEMAERDQVRRTFEILAPVRSRMKQVYVLAGNEPIEQCYQRAMEVIEWGGEPHVQYLRPLDWLGDRATLRHRFDWSDQAGRDFCRFFNRRIYKSAPIREYLPRLNEPPPFASVAHRGLVQVAAKCQR